MLRLLPEAPEHVPAREELLDRCFGPTRYRKTSEKLRRGRLPAAGLAFLGSVHLTFPVFVVQNKCTYTYTAIRLCSKCNHV